MSWTFLPGNLTATGPFFDRVALLAGRAPDMFVEVKGLENPFVRWFHSFAFGACKEGGDALVRQHYGLLGCAVFTSRGNFPTVDDRNDGNASIPCGFALENERDGHELPVCIDELLAMGFGDPPSQHHELHCDAISLLFGNSNVHFDVAVFAGEAEAQQFSRAGRAGAETLKRVGVIYGFADDSLERTFESPDLLVRGTSGFSF